ncbi:MAG: phosphatase domain-containing protein [Corynebacterium sp.]|nr:phosphatase domain-containing protein [Corynebacterium sp.]
MALSDLVRTAEDKINRVGVRRKAEAGWIPTVTGFVGYGTPTKAHILARVLMADPTEQKAENPWAEAERGWRQFFTVQVGDFPVTVTCGSKTVSTHTDPNGYVDVVVYGHGLNPGTHEVLIAAGDSEPVAATVLIVEPTATHGIICDIDDTVMVTSLPRAVLAAWNSWIRKTNTRQPVAGMAEFLHHIQDLHPGTPIVYLSTGAWNTYDTLTLFLEHHGFPTGPLLLTDWGPTPTGLFRNGKEHKRVEMRNLFLEFPEVSWYLVGDNGQHDPLIYGEAMNEFPERIAGVAIRELSPGEHLLSHGTMRTLAVPDLSYHRAVPVWYGRDGYELRASVT